MGSRHAWLLLFAASGAGGPVFAGESALETLKAEAVAHVERMAAFTQEAVDMVFSFGELGYQEFETSRYLTGILRENGFSVRENVAGMPTAWVATWGSGKPVLALGSDLDGIPRASQRPGVAYRAPLIEGAPGHGEGHNSGQAVNITAALALKRIMERERLPGTLILWPGVAEELVGGKAYLVRDGVFNSVDVAVFTHVSDNLSVRWGAQDSTGLVSVEYTFRGRSAHAAAPWKGHSALDAVELMNAGWNYRREHLRLQHRSHYVISRGGDQPNVVPSEASVWYYFRETEYPRIRELFAIGNTMAEAAARMSDTSVTRRILGAAWPQHLNKPVSEAMYANIKAVGLPQWTAADQRLAKALQKEIRAEEKGLSTELAEFEGPPKEFKGGGSDDIGDVSWMVPTVTLRFPANIPELPGHSWPNAVAMATPIAHKGATAGAKVVAMTGLDILLRPELVREAWTYFNDVQTKGQRYEPLLGTDDRPALELNRETMARFRPLMRSHYFNPKKYRTYLEQLGVEYPTVRTPERATAE